MPSCVIGISLCESETFAVAFPVLNVKSASSDFVRSGAGRRPAHMLFQGEGVPGGIAGAPSACSLALFIPLLLTALRKASPDNDRISKMTINVFPVVVAFEGRESFLNLSSD